MLMVTAAMPIFIKPEVTEFLCNCSGDKRITRVRVPARVAHNSA
jgi:hypothetical protein